jgi:hypothetical protein
MDEMFEALSEGLAKAKAKFKVAKMSGINTFFKSPANPKGTPYATTADIDAAITEALSSEGFAPVTVHPAVIEGEWFAKGVLRHKMGGQIEATVPMFLVKRDMQGFKSALTYAQRMLLICLTGVVSAGDDDDGNAAVATTEQPAKARLAVNGMTAENELRKALSAGDQSAAKLALDKVRLRARRGEVDAELLQRAEAAFDKAFAMEVTNG